MSLFVERIIIKNRAPFESVDLTFKDQSISVLTAFNGKGKTTILSYIVDAFPQILELLLVKVILLEVRSLWLPGVFRLDR